MVSNKTIHVAVVVDTQPTKCNIFIPDLGITVHGSDYCEAITNASIKASAIYYYNKEHNINTPLVTTYEEVEKMCMKTDKFPTYLPLM